MAEMIRRFVDRGLAAETPGRERLYQEAAKLVGRFRDREGAGDLADEHDTYLDEAFE